MEKHVVLTGCGKGIGKATALYLDQKGYTVWAGVRNPAHADDLKAAASDRLHPLLIDVTRPDHIAAAAETVRAAVGEAGLFALINNAAVMIPSPLEVLDLDILHRQMAVIVEGPILMMQAFIPLLRQAQGTIINMGSIAGRIALPVYGPYHIAKFALEGMSDTMRQELRPDGVRVVVIEPGAIDTPIWDTVNDHARTIYAHVDPQQLARYQPMIDKINKTNSAAVSRALPPEAVAKLIARIITTRNPRARYTIGMDGVLVSRVVWMLPASWRDWVANKLL